MQRRIVALDDANRALQTTVAGLRHENKTLQAGLEQERARIEDLHRVIAKFRSDVMAAVRVRKLSHALQGAHKDLSSRQQVQIAETKTEELSGRQARNHV